MHEYQNRAKNAVGYRKQYVFWNPASYESFFTLLTCHIMHINKTVLNKVNGICRFFVYWDGEKLATKHVLKKHPQGIVTLYK